MKKLLSLMFFVVTMPLSLHAYSYNGYKVICENGRYGVAYGDIVCVFPQYDSLLIGKTEYKEGVFGAYEAGGKWGVFVNGNRTSEPKFDAVYGDTGMNSFVSSSRNVLFEGKALSYFFVLPVCVGGKWGYADAMGNYVIEPQYAKASHFCQRLGDEGYVHVALVEKDGGWYVIDLLNNVGSEDLRSKLDTGDRNRRSKNWSNAVKKAVKAAQKAREKELAAAAERLHGVYESAKTASALVPDAALKAVQEGSQWRVAGADGKPLSATLYDDVAEPEGGVVRVVKDGKYGLVAAGWGEIVPCSFDYITEFNADGYAEVWNNGFTGHVSKHGHVDLEENLMKNAQNEVRFGKDVTPIQKYVEYNPTSIQGYMLLAEWCERNKYYTDAYKAYDMVFALAEEQGKQDMVANKKSHRDYIYNLSQGVVYEAEPSFLELMGQLVEKTVEIRNSVREIKHGSTAASSGVVPSGGVSSGGSYQTQYKRWENLAERHYNSITNTGARATVNGEHSGTAGSMSPSNYTQQKKAFRQAQREMARIRTKAAKDGVNIPQSRWETATISL